MGMSKVQGFYKYRKENNIVAQDLENNSSINTNSKNLTQAQKILDALENKNYVLIDNQENVIPTPMSSLQESKRRIALIADSDPDILSLYKTYLDNLDFCAITVDNGNKALKSFMEQEAGECILCTCNENEKDKKSHSSNDSNKNECNQNDDNKSIFDIVILNTRLAEKPGLEVAKEIRKNNQSQRIIITTTSPIENLPKDLLKDADIKNEEVLTMPFKFSRLKSILKGPE
jgi:CheY-like chemotaxis protein